MGTVAEARQTGLTVKQQGLVTAAMDPSVKTLTEAGRRAGYDHVQSTHRALNSAKVQEAIAKRERGRGDKARGILSRASNVAFEALNPDSQPDADYALRAMVASAAVIEKVGADDDTSNEITEQDRIDAAALILAAVLYGVRLGRRARPVIEAMQTASVVSPQLASRLKACRKLRQLLDVATEG